MAAFHRGKAVQIVPVLVDTGWPDADQLPADLRWLLQREGQVIRGAEQRSGLAELVKKLEGCLSRRGPGRDSAEPFPWVLPYLCNRIEQEEDLEALIKAQGKGVFACVLHGQVEEVHQGFIDRLTYMRTFDRFFGSPAGVDVRPLTWNRTAAQHKKFDALLRSAVGRCVPASNPPTGTELEAFLADAGRPQVLVLQVTWDDYKACGSSLLPSLVGSWLGLFRSQGTAKPITPSQPMVLWINLAYSTPDANVDLTALEGVLPALPSVQSADIEEWMALREVKTFVARKRGKLLALTEDQRWSPKNGKVHMVKFAEAVEEILNAS
jgi:hypothetical protein